MKIELDNFQKTLNEEKGITLITLIVMIVVLIILVTATINATFEEGGLIRKSKQTKEMTSNVITEEEESMNKILAEHANILAEDNNMPEGPTDPTEQEPVPIEEITKGEIFDQTTKVSDASKDIFYVPGEFGIAEDSPNEIDDGIVITNEGNTKQFVWIPVNDTSLAKMYKVEEATLSKSTLGETDTKTSVYSNLRVRSGDNYTKTKPGGTKGIREPDILTSTSDGDAATGNSTRGIEQIKSILGISGNTNAEVLKNYAQSLVDEYKLTYESIKTYGGFYIGRYEITGDVENPTVQKDGTVIASKNWYNLKKACTNVVSTKYAQSTMIYGNQWDEVMSWLIATGDKTESQVNTNSSDWGNYKDSTGAAATNSGSPQTAGKNEAWKANNIYDLAGNYYERTQEANNTSFRVNRGGYYNSSGSNNLASSGRNGSYRTDISYGDSSSRPTLYVTLNAE